MLLAHDEPNLQPSTKTRVKIKIKIVYFTIYVLYKVLLLLICFLETEFHVIS